MTINYSASVAASAGLTFLIVTMPASLTQTTTRIDLMPIEKSGHVVVLLDTWNRSAMPTNPLDMPDLPLFADENPDVRQEASEVIGEWWLTEHNIRLAGRTPNEVIESGQGARVRNIIRSLKYVSIS